MVRSLPGEAPRIALETRNPTDQASRYFVLLRSDTARGLV